MESWGAYFITFLIGVATGAAGNYFASKYTDRRRDSEDTKKAKDTFKKVKNQMPELISEMKEDFSKNENSSIRELVVLPSNKVMFNSQQPRFIYFEDQHQNLKGKIAILENHGYILDVTVSNAPIYRITEEFWDMVLNS
jgi:hypothetical protein